MFKRQFLEGKRVANDVNISSKGIGNEFAARLYLIIIISRSGGHFTSFKRDWILSNQVISRCPFFHHVGSRGLICTWSWCLRETKVLIKARKN